MVSGVRVISPSAEGLVGGKGEVGKKKRAREEEANFPAVGPLVIHSCHESEPKAKAKTKTKHHLFHAVEINLSLWC